MSISVPRPVIPSTCPQFEICTFQFAMSAPPRKQKHGRTEEGESVAPRLRKAMALEASSQLMDSSVSTGMMESHRRLTVIDTKDL